MAFIDYFTLDSGSIIIRLIAAIVIIVIGFVAARIFSRLVSKVLKELETDKVLKEQAGFRISLEEFASRTVKYLTYFAAIILALNQLSIETIVLQILLYIALIILIIFIVLAFKDFIPNITAGFFIHQKKMLKPGDKIKVKGIEGKIIHVNLIETKIMSKDKDIIYIPNSILTKDIIIKKK